MSKGYETALPASSQLVLTGPRWSLDPAHGSDTAEGWRLTRLRARTAPERDWQMVPQAGKPGALVAAV